MPFNLKNNGFPLIYFILSIFFFFIPAYSSSESFILTPPSETEAAERSAEKKARVLYGIGLRYLSQGNYKDAWVAFNNALQIYPAYKTKLEHYLSLIQQRLAETEMQELERKREFYAAVKDKYVRNLYAAGVYAMQYGRYKDAIKRFEETLELEPGHQGARNNLVQAHLRLKEQQIDREGRKTEFIKGVEQVKIKHIESPIESIEEELAISYEQASNLLKYNWLEKALDKFEEIYQVCPDYRDVQARLADIRLSLLAKERQLKGPPYKLGPADVIDINVFNHPEFSGSVRVEPGGEIILPLVRETVQVEGLSTEEVAQKIQQVLAKYIQEPLVQVVITGYNSKKWYILGEVGLPGEYPLGKTRLTLMEALYQAGLPLEGIAALGRVKIIKPHATEPYSRNINVADILYKGRMQNNIIIEPGDIIYIPKTVLNKITSTLGQITLPLAVIKGSLEDTRDASTAARAITPLKDTFGETATSKK
ncbi:MAG: polysaccharide biosynthesis/export family protein [Candidatus Omnitrophica bacterium]|nr:polysaccharide biosynthesis/export family protein [Candidatus Omnitrophota bacterium]